MTTRRAVFVAALVFLSVGAANVAVPAGPSPSETSTAGAPAVEAMTFESAPVRSPVDRPSAFGVNRPSSFGPVAPPSVRADSDSESAAETTTTESSSPDGTATTTTASPDDALPPGVNQSGVEDAAALVAAHRSSLNESGFSFEFRSNVSVGPASQWTVQRGTVEAGLSPLVIHSTSVRKLDETTTFATDLWADDDTVVVQHSRENKTELRRYNRSGDNVGVPDESWAHLPRADLDSQVTQSWLLELALTVGKFDLDRTERRDGRRVAVLRATEPVAAANFTDLNATLVVDSEGRVHSLSLTATAEGDTDTRIHYEFELTEVGSVEVERPQWVEAAIPPEQGNETTTATTTTRSA